MSASPIVPAQVLQSLKDKARPQKQRNLDVLHAVCEEVNKSGNGDYSLATIGRLTQARGGPSQRTLYTAQSEDFRVLIKAWKDYHEMASAAGRRRTQTKPFGEDDLIRRIDDPALRALLGAVVAERNRLRAELNVLRAHANVVIDRRAQPAVMGGGSVQVVTPGELLTETERESLQRAVSTSFLEQEGWTEGEHGDILNGKGRRIFGHGYAAAIRKLLA